MIAEKQFDFNCFNRCLKGKDPRECASYYCDDTDRLEYRLWPAPKAPIRMVGRKAIDSFIKAFCAAERLTLTLSDEFPGNHRIAIRFTCTFGDERKMTGNVIADFYHGELSRQVGVEAWN